MTAPVLWTGARASARRPRCRFHAHPQRGDRTHRRRGRPRPGGRGRDGGRDARRGRLRREPALARRGAARVPVSAFTRVLARIEPTPGVRELISAVHERGGVVGVVSGGFHEILDTVAPRLGVDVWRANRLEVDAGALTGRVDGRIVDADGKAAALREWATAHDVAPARTIAIGDGANDLRMMAAAGLGIAFNAKPAVRAQADLVVGPVDLREVIPLLP
ncbi:HAD-IB family phosphatase [Microbacterium elymi]|uniref:phosphoserine phosphatase n=1 Tax=Microbacterium elymi TaxID=2909587 RepID=A0ABY3STV9_9MICO|nr:HAD-IB family phosphatase [Microbacterium elymi]UJP12646.2 HAD-IB family phosphatase [Microbacterium elymi]